VVILGTDRVLSRVWLCPGPEPWTPKAIGPEVPDEAWMVVMFDPKIMGESPVLPGYEKEFNGVEK
jgi:hypothetical protein